MSYRLHIVKCRLSSVSLLVTQKYFKIELKIRIFGTRQCKSQLSYLLHDLGQIAYIS